MTNDIRTSTRVASGTRSGAHWLIGFALVAIALTVAGSAAAQAAGGEELPPAPPPEDAASAATCSPSCRSGFQCVKGQCVSACNPPCAAGQECTVGGECVAGSAATPPPAPSFPVPPADDTAQPDHAIFSGRGVEAHDGFMLRLTLGGGFASASIDPSDDGGAAVGVDFSGGGGAFSLDIGGAPSENLIIHGRISDFSMLGPKVEVAGTSGELDGSLGSGFFGAGVTYYFMPINLYLTGTVGFGWLSLHIDRLDEDRSSDAGIGFNFDLGKEWWVGDNWGLGLAGRFVLVRGVGKDDNDQKYDFGMTAFALVFSATYQ